MKTGNQLITLTFLFLMHSLKLMASEDWTKKTFFADKNNHYYVGISEGRSGLNEAMEIAYQNAIEEALRHNFGFLKRSQKNTMTDLFKVEVDDQSFIKTRSVILKNIAPGKQYVKTTEQGKYLVYRQIVYPKSSIRLEQNRLKKLYSGEKSNTELNDYGLKGKVLGDLIVKSTPSGAQILLTRVDGKGSITGSGDARFKIPLGQYHITIMKNGYEPMSKKIIVSGKGSEVEFSLRESIGHLEIDITPKDARVYLDSRKIDNGQIIPIKVGRDYDLRVEHSDYQTFVKNISPWIDQKVTVKTSLIPKKARVSILSRPLGAKVYIKGELIGTTPIKNMHLFAQSNVEVKVSKNGYDSHTERIDLLPNNDHVPLVVTLKKGSRAPTAISKKNSIQNENTPNRGLSILSNNLSKHNFIYNPIVSDSQSTTYVMIPLQYQYFVFRHLAVGFDYRYHIEEESLESLDKETTGQVWSLNSTFYLIRNSRFSFAVGPEYTWRKTTVDYKKPGFETNLLSQSVQAEALGYKAIAQFGVMKRDNGHQFGINLDYRRYDLSNTKLGSWSVGLYWEF